MWTLRYSREANNYALDSYPYNEDLLVAIELLAQTPGGLPASNYREWKPKHILWQVAGHYVAYYKTVEPHPTIIILTIKPMR